MEIWKTKKSRNTILAFFIKTGGYLINFLFLESLLKTRKKKIIFSFIHMNLNVIEIFYSLQGEGGRQGEASIFIRLSGCNLQCDFCDTFFKKGEDMTLEFIALTIKKFHCKWIVWTGGEPTLQLTDDVLLFFKQRGFFQAIESNGHRKLNTLLDYTVVSPKGTMTYAKLINGRVNEVRVLVKKGMFIPEIELFPIAESYFLSPIFSKDTEETQANIAYCVSQIKLFTQWRLSLQIHKLIGLE